MFTPVGFRFRVRFKDFPDTDCSFLSVSGLEVMMAPDPLATTKAQKMKLIQINSPLLLTRAAETLSDSPLNQWIFQNLSKKNPLPLSEVCIELLDEANQATFTWTVRQLTFKSWKLGELNATKSEVLLEMIELNYAEIVSG